MKLSRTLFLFGFCCARVAMATTVVPPTLDALVNESDYIVHAVTKSVTAQKRTDPHGEKIVTRVELEVLEVVAGSPPSQLTIEMLGGRVGDEEMIVEGMPRFKIGDEDILFVRGNGRSISPLYGMMHGRYSIEKTPATGRKYILRADGMPLRDAAQIASPLNDQWPTGALRAAAAADALAPAEFIRQIRAKVRPGARLHRAQ